MREVDLVIIGGGSAGMAAAISAYDNGIKDIVILEKTNKLGGILNQCIHNGFGLTEFKEELTGPEFLARFAIETKKRNIEVKYNSFVNKIDLDKVIHYMNNIEGDASIKAKAIIVAMGCYERTAGAIALPGSRPSGVITAGTAQAYINLYGYMPGKKFFILGSGDIGLIMARRITLEGGEVLGVAEVCPYSNGLNRNITQCLKDFNIPLYLSHTVTKVIGKDRVEAVEVSEVDQNRRPIPGTERIFECDTLILSIGLIPNSFLMINSFCKFAKGPGIAVDNYLQTSFDGLFTCGNVLHVHDLVDYVVSEARIAGRSAALYLQGKLNSNGPKINVISGEGISYALPHQIVVNPIDDIELKFRVNKPYSDKKIVIKFNNIVIKQIMKVAIIPSEMELVKLDKNIFNEEGTLTIELMDK